MENPTKMNDLGMIWGYHYFWKHPYGVFTRYQTKQYSVVLNYSETAAWALSASFPAERALKPETFMKCIKHRPN